MPLSTSLRTQKRVIIKPLGSDKAESGEVPIVQWSKRARLIRALKALAWAWLAAMVAVVIPVLHFVLVPMLLLIGVPAAVFIYFQRSRIEAGFGTCPICNGEVKILSGQVRWPIFQACNSCGGRLKIFIEDDYSV